MIDDRMEDYRDSHEADHATDEAEIKEAMDMRDLLDTKGY